MNRLEHTFHVKFLDFPDLSPRLLAFTGDLELNVPFRLEMEISLSAQELSKIDRKKLLGTDASLSIYDSEHSEKDKHHSAHFIKWCGKIAKIQLIRSYLDSIFILITLESALGALSSLIQNRLYLGKTGPDIVKECLTAEGLVPESILDFSLDRGAYPKREFLLSKNEETLDFALFNLGRDGVSFFSTWNGEEERIVFCDSNTSFIPIMDGDEELEFRVSDPSGLAPNKEP
ncbi:MAG: phage late control D family protein, partial [Deltaproteobacteria bacterium]|nr:phage late control D family protein [Deltaproteobacteria bacterium]